jgi:hypothetical protein
MTKLAKYFRFIGAASALVFSLGFGHAFAMINVTGGNGTTGFSSTNTNTWDITPGTSVTVDNASDVTNTPDITVNNGNNSISDNTVVGDVMEGDITGNVSIMAAPGAGDIDLGSFTPDNVNLDFTNDTTGPNSDNENTVTLDDSNTWDITNSPVVDNEYTLNIDSGHNTIGDNTKVGDVTGGDINYTTTINNSAADNMGVIGMPNLSGADVSANLGNNITGPNSSNLNAVTVDGSNTVDITNTQTTTNNATITANSGNNSVSDNTVVGDIHTGGINVGLNIAN